MSYLDPYQLQQYYSNSSNYIVNVSGTAGWTSATIDCSPWMEDYLNIKQKVSAKPKTNVDWLRARVDEMRVPLA